MDEELENIITFWSSVFRMTAGVLIKSGTVGQERIGRPAIGNEALEDIAKDFLNRQIHSPIGRKRKTVFTLKPINSFHHFDTCIRKHTPQLP
jgi:hypothetical protein